MGTSTLIFVGDDQPVIVDDDAVQLDLTIDVVGCTWPEAIENPGKSVLCPNGTDFTTLRVSRDATYCHIECDTEHPNKARAVVWSIRDGDELGVALEPGLDWTGDICEIGGAYTCKVTAGTKSRACPIIIRATDVEYPDCFQEIAITIGCGGCQDGNCNNSAGSATVAVSSDCAEPFGSPMCESGLPATLLRAGQTTPRGGVSVRFSTGTRLNGDVVEPIRLLFDGAPRLCLTDTKYGAC